MWKALASFYLIVFMAACAHSGGQEAVSEISSIQAESNPSGVWRAVWVKGFDPDWPPAAEVPFDWTQNQLTTAPDDPGDWGKFYGGCNKLWRFWEIVKSKDGEIKRWGIVPGQDGCTEWVQDGEKEIFSRSIYLERAVTGHVANAQDRRLEYQIDAEGYLIWLDKGGNPVARFKPLPDWHSCDNLRARAAPMPIICNESIYGTID